MLRVVGLEFAELRHSDVLAWFLRSTAEHEQGALFLNALLVLLKSEPVTVESYAVWRERHCNTDVSTNAEGLFAVFIENKVKHVETEGQIAKLIAALVEVSHAYNVPRERRFAVFLTDRGTKPGHPPESDSQFLREQLRPLSRVQLFECFRAALAAQGASNYSPLLMNFLDSYLHNIRRNRARIS